MNEEQRQAARGLVTAFVGSNVDLFDPGYNANVQAAGEMVIAGIEQGHALHQIESQGTPLMIEIVAFLREHLFPGGEVVAPPNPVVAATGFWQRVWNWVRALVGVGRCQRDRTGEGACRTDESLISSGTLIGEPDATKILPESDLELENGKARE